MTVGARGRARWRPSSRWRSHSCCPPAARVTVPDVTGQSEQAAGATLRRAGLTPVPSLRRQRDRAAGLVISQTPGRRHASWTRART